MFAMPVVKTHPHYTDTFDLLTECDVWLQQINEGETEVRQHYTVQNNGGRLTRLPQLNTRDHAVDSKFETFEALKKALSAYAQQRPTENKYGLLGSFLHIFFSKKILSFLGIYSKADKLKAAQTLQEIVDAIDQFKVPSAQLLERFATDEPVIKSGRLGALMKGIDQYELKECILLAQKKYDLERSIKKLNTQFSQQELLEPDIKNSHLGLQVSPRRLSIHMVELFKERIDAKRVAFSSKIEQDIRPLLQETYNQLLAIRKPHDDMHPWYYFTLCMDRELHQITETFFYNVRVFNQTMSDPRFNVGASPQHQPLGHAPIRSGVAAGTGDDLGLANYPISPTKSRYRLFPFSPPRSSQEASIPCQFAFALESDGQDPSI